MGVIAKKSPGEGEILQGVLVQKDFKLSLMDPEDLREFSGLATSTILERQVVAYRAGKSLLRWHLQQMFGGVREEEESLIVMDVRVQCLEEKVVVEWAGNALNDTIADAVLAVILGIEGSPDSVRQTAKPCGHSDQQLHEEKMQRLSAFLEVQFGDAVQATEKGADIHIDAHKASVNFASLQVDCAYEPLRSRVRKVLEHALGVISDFECT